MYGIDFLNRKQLRTMFQGMNVRRLDLSHARIVFKSIKDLKRVIKPLIKDLSILEGKKKKDF